MELLFDSKLFHAIHKEKPERHDKVEKKEKPEKKGKYEPPEKMEKKEKAIVSVSSKEKTAKQEKKKAVPSPKVTEKMKTEQQERMGEKVVTKDKKSIQVEEKIKKDVKEKKPEAKAPERLKTKEIKAPEVTSPKPKEKKETALAVREKVDHQDQFAFCRYMIDMFAHGNLYTGSLPPQFLEQTSTITALLPAAEVGKLNVTATKKVEKGKKVVQEKKAIPQVIRKEEERKKVTAEKKDIPEMKKKEVKEIKKIIHEKKYVSDIQAKGLKEEKRKTPERTMPPIVKKAGDPQGTENPASDFNNSQRQCYSPDDCKEYKSFHSSPVSQN
ncbi:triadin-like [Erythrolamprus reginae]|uniref:triadin-like n=1 Tax=Erythrolamprus reginae TaxID=121349 RepID=UPI00396CE009